MRIEINPRSLLNLENICEVLYKLHPSVLDYLVDMQRSLGGVLGFINLDNPSLEEREFLANNYEEKDNSLSIEQEDLKYKVIDTSKYSHLIYEEIVKTKDLSNLKEEDKSELAFSTIKDEYRHHIFHELRKYIQLDTDEYIPIKISVEVEDPVIGKKVRELIRALETTRAPEQFYLNKKEIDEYAYFAEGYEFEMSEEQIKKSDKFFGGEDVESLKELLEKEKLYP